MVWFAHMSQWANTVTQELQNEIGQQVERRERVGKKSKGTE